MRQKWGENNEVEWHRQNGYSTRLKLLFLLLVITVISCCSSHLHIIFLILNLMQHIKVIHCICQDLFNLFSCPSRLTPRNHYFAVCLSICSHAFTCTTQITAGDTCSLEHVFFFHYIVKMFLLRMVFQLKKYIGKILLVRFLTV